MPIPPFQGAGLLPLGVHTCTIEEVRDRFGRFQNSDRRPRLFGALEAYLTELRAARIGKYLVVDGSFVTGEDTPNDIDVLLILRDDFAPEADLPPYQYNAQSRRYVRRHFGLDFFFGFENDPSSEQIMELFRDVKNQPGMRKGMLAIAL